MERLFLAVPLPPHLDYLRRQWPGWSSQWPAWKWVSPENLHITLKFLGEVAPDRLPALEESIPKALTNLTPFQVELEGLGVFPNFQRPRVMWVGIHEGGEPLARIAAGLEEFLFQVGFPKEERPWQAHLTISRCRPGRPPGDLTDFVSRHESKSFGSFPVNAISLMESHLQPTGPVYKLKREFPLGKS